MSLIDKRTCVPLISELHAVGGKLRKVLRANRDRIEKVKSVWIPHDLLMEDVRDGTSTRLVVKSVQLGVSFPQDIHEKIDWHKPELPIDKPPLRKPELESPPRGEL